ncbi:DUF1561 family protein, partial [Leptospira noguchii]|uniref:DUF1561 family protein n=1 Tax=Leptospira noguchii TaxID=28182 RepID=UPI000773453B
MYNWKVLIIIFLVSVGTILEYGINYTFVHASSSKVNYSIIQKPTDKPKDKPIKVVVSNKKAYCYSPAFTKGEGYVWIDK